MLKPDLKDLLQRLLANYNATCGPFTWTKGPEQLQRIIESTKQSQPTHPRQPRRKQSSVALQGVCYVLTESRLPSRTR